MTPQDLAKILCATHYFINISKSATKVASAMGITTPELYKIVESPYWRKALEFWGYDYLDHKPIGYRRYKRRKRIGDISKANKCWKRLFETYNPERVTNIPVVKF